MSLPKLLVLDDYEGQLAIAADQFDMWLKGHLSRKEVINPEAMKVSRTRIGNLA